MTTTDMRGQTGPKPALEITPEKTPEFTFPLSATQTQFLFLDQLRPGDPSLNVAVRWELRGDVRVDHVEHAFQTIIARHEALRTRIFVHGEAGAQEVLTGVDFRLERVDLSASGLSLQEREIERLADEHASRKFDLSSPPLIRVAYVNLGQGRAMLLVVVHHCVFDGFSIGVMGKEFSALLEAFQAGSEAALPQLPLQYGDYALWQEQYLSSDAVEEDKEFWATTMRGYGYFELKPDHRRPKVRSTAGDHIHLDLPASFGERLEATARRHETSPFALGAGVLSGLFSAWSGAEDIAFGTQIAGREESDLEGLIGVFINNLVLRIPTSSERTLADQIASAKAVVQQALLHQNLPFNKLVEVLRPERDPSRNPIISINFNLQRRTFLENRKTDRFELISRPSFAAGTIYDLNILLIGRPDGWRLTIEYATDLFVRETAERLAKDFVASLERAFDAPQTRVGELPRRRDAVVRKAPEREANVQDMPAVVADRPARQPATITELPVRPRSPAPAPADAANTGRISGRETAERIAGIWGDLLDLDPDVCDGDFFSLGGHSLLAMRMLARVEQAFGIKPGIALFLANPTLGDFARKIDLELTARARREAGAGRAEDAGARPTWELIELRASPSDAVIVTINHPIFYYMLAGSFSAVATLANLRIPDEAAIARQAGLSFDEICGEPARLIAEAYPNRDVVILGLCVNGRLALRIAQLLEENGVAVRGTVMLDCWAPGAFASETAWRRFARRMDLRRKRWGHYLALRLRGRIGTLDLLRKNALAESLLRRLDLAPPLADEERLLGEVTGHLQAKTRDYRFAGHSGRALLFKTEASSAEAVDRMFGWEQVLPEDTPVYPVTGWHEDALSNSGMARVARIIDKRMLSDDRDDARTHRDRRPTSAGGRGTSAA